MKRVIITGATGFIGIHLIEELCACQYEIYAVCRPASSHLNRILNMRGVHIVECDLNNLDALSEQIKIRGFDAFFHLGWEGPSGPLRFDYTTQIENVRYSCTAASAAKALACKKFILAGTVYQRLCDDILNQNVYRGPSFYLLAKEYTYEILQQLTLKIELPFTCCTFFHPVGRYMKPEQLMAYAAKCYLTGEEAAFGPAQDWFDVISVKDLARALRLTGEKELPRKTYYIGSGDPQPLEQYLRRMRQLLNPNAPLGIGKRADDGLRFQQEWLDSSAFEADSGFQPEDTFEAAIRDLAAGL